MSDTIAELKHQRSGASGVRMETSSTFYVQPFSK